MTYSDVDCTDERRLECEKLITREGHVSPRGSLYECASCDIRIPWKKLRWVRRTYSDGRTTVVGGVHDCKRPNQ